MLIAIVGVTISSVGMATTGMPNQVVIIKLSDDNIVNYSIGILKEEHPNAAIVDFGSLRSSLTLMSYSMNVILVGHADERGVLVGNTIRGWQFYADYISTISSNNIILLNCESSRITPYLHHN